MKPRGHAPSAGSFDITPRNGVVVTLHIPPLRRLWLAGVAIMLIALILGYQAHLLLANVRTLAPLTCTGDWEGASSLSDMELKERRALAKDAGQKIFCTFPSPSAKAVPLTRAVLALSFASPNDAPAGPPAEAEAESEEDAEPEARPDESSEDAQVPDEPTEDGPGEVLGETAPLEEAGSEQPAASKAAPAEESIGSEPAEEAVSEPEAQPEPEPAPEESEPTARSWWHAFFSVAHAQETEPVEEAAAAEPDAPFPAEPVQEVSPAEESAEDISVEEPVLDAAAESDAEELPSEDEVVPEEGEVLGADTSEEEVLPASELTLSYTLDGTRWVQLTSFSPRGNEVTFDIDLTSTADLDKFVVRLTADSIGDAPIALEGVEVRIYTEAPIEELLEMALPEDTGVLHVYTKDFTIDPKAAHACAVVPGRLSIADTAFAARLGARGEDLSASPEPAVEASVDDAALEEHTEATEEADAPDEAAAKTEALSEDAGGEPVSEEMPGETPGLETSVPDEAAAALEEPADDSFLGGMLSAGAELAEAVALTAEDLLDGELAEPYATLEIGSLPQGIDVRFLETAGYQLEFENGVPEEVPLTLAVSDPETAQKGSFSIPLIYTMNRGKDSTVVCLMNIINTADHD